MINRNVLMSGIAAAVLVAASSVSFAQMAPQPAGEPGTDMYPNRHHGVHHATAGVKGTPHTLTVTPRPVAAPVVDPITGVTTALASPFNAVGAAGGPIVGTGFGVAGSAITGAGTIIGAPFAGLTGTAPGISGNAAPPLPIKARFAGTGPVASTFDEGFAQDVPVDKSGPIYMIDNTGHDRTVTPFSLLAFPISGATYAITSPLRPVAPHP